MDDQNVQNPGAVDPTVGQQPVQSTPEPVEPVMPSFTPPVEPVKTGDPVTEALQRIEEKLSAIAVKVGA
jgi:hypothetical protein